MIRIKSAMVKTIRMDPLPALELWQTIALYEKHGLHQLAALAAHPLYLPKGEKKENRKPLLSYINITQENLQSVKVNHKCDLKPHA